MVYCIHSCNIHENNYLHTSELENRAKNKEVKTLNFPTDATLTAATFVPSSANSSPNYNLSTSRAEGKQQTEIHSFLDFLFNYFHTQTSNKKTKIDCKYIFCSCFSGELGIDRNAELTEDGTKCFIQTDMVESYTRQPLLKCNKKMEENCHQTFITYFKPTQEKVCEEFFEKKCRIIFTEKKRFENIVTCQRPHRKVCDGSGPEKCRTAMETSCTTRVQSEDRNSREG